MLALYGMVHGMNNSEAYHAICDDMMSGSAVRKALPCEQNVHADTPQAQRASAQDIHKTLTGMLSMLTLNEAHREHLHTRRGLDDEQIERFGFKSTPNPLLGCRIASILMKNGFVLQGVPGFYIDKKGRWTIKFCRKTSGFLIPVMGIEGLIRGVQIRLDHPIRDENDPPDKDGTKYIWFSSTGRNRGTSSGSPVHFVGDPLARVVYVTEGALKADIAHALTGRSFLATAGANNVSELDYLFAALRRNGTEEIIEAEDMDKYRNKAVSCGASKVYQLARKNSLACRRLTWNPRYKGIDDWQLALREQDAKQEEKRTLNFKERYLRDYCEISDINQHVVLWHQGQGADLTLQDYLGLTGQEYDVFLRDGTQGAFEKMLDSQRKARPFRIYQIDLNLTRTVPYAFMGTEELHKLGYDQPPAEDYRLVYDSLIHCPIDWDDDAVLERIFERFNLNHPADYRGHSLSVSDIVELYDDTQNTFYYCDSFGFTPIPFSPAPVIPSAVKNG